MSRFLWISVYVELIKIHHEFQSYDQKCIATFLWFTV